MSDLGTLKVGMRTLTYFFFNGVVVNRSDSTHTETTYEQGTNRVVSSYTDHRSNLIIEGADGNTQQINATAAHVSIKEGARVTLVMVARSETGKQAFVAVRDNDTGQIGYFAKGVNDAAGPPLYNMGIIVALIIGALTITHLSIANLVPLGLAGWFFYELYRRRKLVRAHAVKVIEKHGA
jgi:hypothetical protein